MNKEDVLQKVNDYCTEKAYTSETLTDVFKDKFAAHFADANPDGDINDEAVLNNMKFALNTAFSSASTIITEKTNAFTSKENDYKKQIEELNAKLGQQQEPPKPEIPKEIQDRLDELEKYKSMELKANRKKEVIKLAKEGIRPYLHASFDNYVSDYEAVLDTESKDQAKKLVDKFQAIFKDSIGDIKPLAPKQVQKRDEEYLDGIPKVSVE